MALILAVDDSISMRSLVAKTLVAAGHTVVEASDGQQALSLAKDRTFSLVISDVNMPVMDGLAFVREFRKLGTGRFTPFLFLTTEIDATKKAEAKQAGATGWIVKPFSPESLLATIKKVL